MHIEAIDKTDLFGRVLGFLILSFYTMLSLASLYLLVVSSLTHLGMNFDLSDLDWFPRDWAWDNFTGFFELTRGAAWLWLRNSVLIAILPTLVSLTFSSMAGYALAKLDFPGKMVIFWVIIGVMTIPGFVTLIPLYQMIFSIGWFDSFNALIVPRLAGLAGIFLFKQFMMTLPRDLIEAARIDGASEWKIFWTIIIPMAQPVLAVMFLLDFVSAWGDYFWPYMVTNSPSKMTLQVGLISMIGVDQNYSQNQDFGIIMAGSLMISLPVIIVFLFMQRYFIRGLTIGAVKG